MPGTVYRYGGRSESRVYCRAVTLRQFFEPTGVVLVGATGDPAKLGHGVAENLLTFPGAVHFVGRETGTLFGRPVYARIEDVPDPTNPENLLKEDGRGILFMQNFVNEVEWHNHPEGGMLVRMIKTFG